MVTLVTPVVLDWLSAERRGGLGEERRGEERRTRRRSRRGEESGGEERGSEEGRR